MAGVIRKRINALEGKTDIKTTLVESVFKFSHLN